VDDERTHASFFSGVGGLDMGLERAGWRTVSFSEVDPYASAVLAQRWPGVPNLGDITSLAGELGAPRPQQPAGRRQRRADLRLDGGSTRTSGPLVDPVAAIEDREWGGDRLVASGAATATLWTGGFPCQDLSVAGKRRGMGEGTRSGLAYSFLALAERHRPRFVLLENVPGLLSSHGGRDMAALIGALVELGYGVGYRVLDARYFGVPQRRRRVFILGDSLGGRAGAERAAEVLSVGSRCDRHPPTGIEAGPGVTDGARPGVDIARTVVGTAGKRHDEDIDTLVPTLRVGGRASGAGSSYDNTPYTVVPGRLDGERAVERAGLGAGREDRGIGSSLDPRGMRATDGLAGRSHDRADVADTLNSGGNNGGFRTEPGAHLVYAKQHRAASVDDFEGWSQADVAPTLNDFDTGDTRAVTLALGGGVTDDDLLPLGVDSHRYRCCGNGVVSDVSEYIGHRLAAIA
jgi:site-specific DNA-cytosine methylase